jgi:hypothetical protein
LNGNNGFKPTSLRDALEDALVEANVNHKIKEALMGHVSDIEHEYGGHNKLIINVVEAMKKAYPLLSLNGLTRISTDQHVSKEEFESMKQRLQEMEQQVQTLAESLAPFQKLLGNKFTILTAEGKTEVNLNDEGHTRFKKTKSQEEKT